MKNIWQRIKNYFYIMLFVLGLAIFCYANLAHADTYYAGYEGYYHAGNTTPNTGPIPAGTYTFQCSNTLTGSIFYGVGGQAGVNLGSYSSIASGTYQAIFNQTTTNAYLSSSGLNQFCNSGYNDDWFGNTYTIHFITSATNPTNPTISLLLPSSTVGQYPNFSKWLLLIGNLNSTTSYLTGYGVQYGFSSSTFGYSDSANIYASYGNATGTFSLLKQYMLSLSTTTVVYVQPWVSYVGGTATGTIKSFTVNPALAILPDSSGFYYGGVLYSSSTLINGYPLSDISPFFGFEPSSNANPVSSSSIGVFQIASSSCTGYLDITCELGNFFAGAWNLVFGYQPNLIYNLTGNITSYDSSGTLIYNTPWASNVNQVVSTFEGVGSVVSSTVSSTVVITLPLGSKTITSTVFSVSGASTLMGSSWIAMMKGFAYFGLIAIMLTGWVMQLLGLFRKEPSDYM